MRLAICGRFRCIGRGGARTTTSGHELPVAALEGKEVDFDEKPPPAAAEEALEEEEEDEEEVDFDEKPAAPARWTMPQETIDAILSWDVADDVAPNLERFDDLPFSEEEKAACHAQELKGVAARNELRRVKRDTQQWIRDDLEKQGYVVVEERHLVHKNLAPRWQ